MALRAYCDKCDAPGDLRWLPGAQHDWGVELFLSWEGKQCSTQTVCKNCMADIVLRTFRAFKDTTVVQDFEDKLRSLELLPKLQKTLGDRTSERDDARAKHEFDQKNFKSKAEAFDTERGTLEQRIVDVQAQLAETQARLKAVTQERNHQAELASRVRIDDAAIAADRTGLEQRIEAERRKTMEAESQRAALDAKLKTSERHRQDLLEAAQRSAIDIEAAAATRIAQARRIKEVETALADANTRLQHNERFKEAIENQSRKNAVEAAAVEAERGQLQQQINHAHAERRKAEDSLKAVEREKTNLVVSCAALEKRASLAESAATLATSKLKEAASRPSASPAPSTPAPAPAPRDDRRLAEIQNIADQLHARLRDEQQRADDLQKALKAAEEAIAGAAWTKEREQLLEQMKAANDARELAVAQLASADSRANDRVKQAVAAAKQEMLEDEQYQAAVRKRESIRRS
jgi:chromosome segregation ATPase